MIVPTYDRAQFKGKHFHREPQVESYHHFYFSRDSSGVVTLKAFSDSADNTFHFLHNDFWAPTITQLATTELVPGLSSGTSTERSVG